MPTDQTEDKPKSTKSKSDIPALNTKAVEKIKDALKDRRKYEQKLARAHHQRFCLDRPSVNNYPYPKASNFRYPLSDTLIDQKKPFLFKVIFSSENLAFFKGLMEANIPFGLKCANFFDFIVKEKTDFEEIIQYALDAYLQDGEDWVKTTWDLELEIPVVKKVDNLFIITPSKTKDHHKGPWMAEVLQMSKREFKKRYGKIENIETLISEIEDSNADEDADEGDRDENEYEREGISCSKADKYFVVYEYHYQAGDSRRMRTISPDKPEFDFQDDIEYHYEWLIKSKRYMYEHGKRELINENLHSSRGYPEVVREGESLMSGIVRSQHNALAIYGSPPLVAPNGLPANTQNINWSPTAIIPFEIKPLQLGNPPFSWQEELNNQRGIWERRAAAPDFGMGKANTQNDPRTAREVQAIANQQMLGVELEAGNWKRHLRAIYRQMWALIVQYKPKSLVYYMGDELAELPPEALNNDYLIMPSGSAEAVNKEFMGQKAITLFQMAQGNPYANQGEIFKNVLEWSYPGQVNRFFTNPQQRQEEQAKKTASDISAIISTGAAMVPDKNDDFYTAAKTGIQIMQSIDQRGQPMPPDVGPKIANYIAIAREELRKSNPQQYQQLTQELDMIDQQNQMKRQQGMMQQQQAAMQAQAQPPAQPAPQVVQAAPAPVPTNKKVDTFAQVVRDENGKVLGLKSTSIEQQVDALGRVVRTNGTGNGTALIRRNPNGEVEQINKLKNGV
jgi:hypothetical protein